MKKYVLYLVALVPLIFFCSCVDFNAQRPSIDLTYNDYLSYKNTLRRNISEYSEYINEEYIIEIENEKDTTPVAIKRADNESIVLQFNAAGKSYDHKKYRYFGEDNNKYLFLDVWEVNQGGINLIDGHIGSYIIYFTDSGVNYEKTPDNAVPLLIKDKCLYAYNKLQFLKIDMETGQEEVLYKLPFEGEFPPHTPKHNSDIPDMDSNTCNTYEFIISTDQIIFQGDKYASSETIVFCTVDISNIDSDNVELFSAAL